VEAHVSKRTQYNRELRQRIAAEVITHYGGQCTCCGATGDLSIDHPNGDGSDHREELFGRRKGVSSFAFYLWLRRSGFPEGYQVLCLPCNRSKAQSGRCHIAHDMPGFKWCSHPRHVGESPLPLEEFHRHTSTFDGRRSYCKDCMSNFVMPNYPNRGRKRKK
jgi:hypothetical protein